MFLYGRGANECKSGLLLRGTLFFAAHLQRPIGKVDKLQVQSGGSFDIDYEVVGPNDKIILKDSKERQGDFVFTAQTPGEYRFCFSNEGYTAQDKMVDFEIAVRPWLPNRAESVQSD